MTNDRFNFNDIVVNPEVKTKANVVLIQKMVKLMDEEGTSFVQAADMLSSEGEKISKNIIHNLYKKYNSETGNRLEQKSD